MTVPGAVFVVTLIVFTCYAVGGYRRTNSSFEFFHLRGTRRNFVALVVANITLGTGLAYLLTAGANNGLLMLAAPIGVCLGYMLLAEYLGYLRRIPLMANQNLLSKFQLLIDQERKKMGLHTPSIIHLTLTAPLILVYLLVFAFETFVSSQLLAPIIWPNGGTPALVAVAGAIFFAALSYCTLGGMQSVYRNDVLQFFGIVAFIAIVGFGSYTLQAPNRAFHLPIYFDRLVLLNCFIAFVGAVTTQFYSLLNIYIGANIQGVNEQSRLMRYTGLVVSGLLSIIVLAGALSSETLASGFPLFLSRITTMISGQSIVGNLFLAVMTFGMTAVVISTIDTLMISLTYFISRNFLARTIVGEEGSQLKLGRARIILLSLFVVAFVLLIALFLLSPDIFYLLLSIANGPIVLAPLLIVMGLLACETGGMQAISNGWLLANFALFLSASFSSFAMLSIAPLVLPYISMLHLSISIIFATVLYVKGMRCSNSVNSTNSLN